MIRQARPKPYLRNPSAILTLSYWEYNITCKPELIEILLAYLSASPFDTFQEYEEGIKAYMPDSQTAESQADQALKDLSDQFEFSVAKQQIPETNWNAVWESNFKPVVVEDFCGVRAEFHEPLEGVRHELVIQPKMAFGSGHHETTWMCMKAMQNMPVSGQVILDYGCGTGILAILASRLGAKSILAIDIEAVAEQNTRENAERNQTTNIEARCGTLVDVQETGFDGILANINRNVIRSTMSAMFNRLKPGGWLLCSGFILDDEQLMLEEMQQSGFTHKSTDRKGNWLCMLFTR